MSTNQAEEDPFDFLPAKVTQKEWREINELVQTLHEQVQYSRSTRTSTEHQAQCVQLVHM